MVNQELEDLRYNDFEKDQYYNKDYGMFFFNIFLLISKVKSKFFLEYF
jgi:hypothetical protein